MLEETLGTAALSKRVQAALAVLNHDCLESSSDSVPHTRVQVWAHETLSRILSVRVEDDRLRQSVQDRELLSAEGNDWQRLAIGAGNGTTDTVLASNVDGSAESGDGQVGESKRADTDTPDNVKEVLAEVMRLLKGAEESLLWKMDVVEVGDGVINWVGTSTGGQYPIHIQVSVVICYFRREGNVLGADTLAHLLAITKSNNERTNAAIFAIDHQASND